MWDVDLTATGSGYYRVWVDGVQVSQHTTEREATERAVERKLAEPLSAVSYDHDYTVRVDTPAERRSGYDRRQVDVSINRPGVRQSQRRGTGAGTKYPHPPVVVQVRITDPPAAALPAAATYQFTAQVISSPMLRWVGEDFSWVSDLPITDRTVTWASSDTGVATINSSGLLTAVAGGTTQITADCEGTKSLQVAVEVEASAPTVDEVVVAPATFTVFEGATQQLTATPQASGSYVPGAGAAAWTTSNGAVATVGASTGLVTGVASGTATITATIDTIPGTSACTVAVVPPPPGGGQLVVFPDADTETILGPLLIDGSVDNPWSFFDTNQKDAGTLSGDVFPDFYPSPATATGTVAVTNGSATVTGTGTAFLTEFSKGMWLWVRNAANTGWDGQVYVSSVASDTSMTLTANWIYPTGSGLAINRNVGGAYTTQLIGATFYYDTALTSYNTYYRTGTVSYRTTAREAADMWYSSQMNSGVFTGDAGIAPRTAYLPGLMLRALDGRAELWDAIERYATAQFNTWVYVRKDNAGLHFGIRDGAFATLFIALLCQVLPDTYRNTADTADVDGVARRAYHKARLASVLVDYYDRLQYTDGGWYFTDNWTTDYGFTNIPDGAYATLPFHIGYLLEALIQCHRLFDGDASYVAVDAAVEAMILDGTTWAYTMVRQDQSNVANVKLRSLWYLVARDGLYPNVGMGVNSVQGQRYIDDRQLNSMITSAFGYCYKISGDPQWLIKGDDVFSATFGYLTGAGSDGKIGLCADLVTVGFGYYSRRKEYNQAYRAGGRYLAWRKGA